MKPVTLRLIAVLALTVLAWVAISSVAPPDPAPVTAPETEFSAHRAAEHLEVIAREIHPVGSEAAVRVREYIAGEIRKLGIEPEEQETVVTRQGLFGNTGGRVVNLLARLEGEGGDGGKDLLLMAHYDSARSSYGAGDDGSGVVTLLEVMRALRQGPPLTNDVVFLFTDGEEAGLLGAIGFVEQHPAAEDVGMVLNFEARGTHGPSLMFETSVGNSRMIRTLKEHGGRPAATSYSYEIYKLLPNDTDFTPFRDAGYRGMNFAFIGDESAYHTSQDNLERLSLASLQHHGEQALGLARAYGNADLTSGWETPDATYFNLLGLFVVYPGSLVLPLALLALLGVVTALVFGLRRKTASIGGFLASVALQLMGIGLTGAVTLFLGGWGLADPYDFRVGSGWSTDGLVLLGVTLVALGVSALLHRLFRLRLKAGNLGLAGLFLGSLLALLILTQAPGASYLFSLPVLFSLPAAFALLGRSDEEEGGLVGLALTLVGGGLIVLVWAPTLFLLGSALAQVAVGLTGATVFLWTAGVLGPVLPAPPRGPLRWALPVATLVIGLVVVVYGFSSQDFSPQNRQPTSLFYALDTERGEARWYSFDPNPSEWAREVVGGDFTKAPLPSVMGDFEVSSAEAPRLDLAAADFEVRRPDPKGSIQVTVRLPPDVDRVLVEVTPLSAVDNIRVDGQRTERMGSKWDEEPPYRLDYFAPGEEIQMSLRPVDGSPFTLKVGAQSFGLDGTPGLNLPERGEGMMTGWGWNGDSVMVLSSVEIDPAELASEADPAEDQEPGSEAGPDTLPEGEAGEADEASPNAAT